MLPLSFLFALRYFAKLFRIAPSRLLSTQVTLVIFTIIMVSQNIKIIKMLAAFTNFGSYFWFHTALPPISLMYFSVIFLLPTVPAAPARQERLHSQNHLSLRYNRSILLCNHTKQGQYEGLSWDHLHNCKLQYIDAKILF